MSEHSMATTIVRALVDGDRPTRLPRRLGAGIAAERDGLGGISPGPVGVPGSGLGEWARLPPFQSVGPGLRREVPLWEPCILNTLQAGLRQNARRALTISDCGMVLDLGRVRLKDTGEALLNNEEVTLELPGFVSLI